MINFKSGPALSLHQVNYIGKAVEGENVEAGNVVRLVDNGGVVEVRLGASASPAPSNVLYGFAINNQTDGDVIESGKIGVYALDGASILETDKTAAAITSTNYPLGAALTVDTDGNVATAGNGDKVIGWVEGIRSLPGKVLTATDNNGKTVKIQGSVTFLGVKLAS